MQACKNLASIHYNNVADNLKQDAIIHQSRFMLYYLLAGSIIKKGVFMIKNEANKNILTTSHLCYIIYKKVMVTIAAKFVIM